MKSLIVIPARGGSKGVPGKNIRLLNGKPLIQYTVEEARKVFDDSLICVSTDSLEIKQVVESIGLQVPFLRPAHLATDSAGTYEVLLHALEFYAGIGYNPDLLVLLQPTSPFRSAEQITNAIVTFDMECEMVVSVKETKANPYYILREENTSGWLEQSKQGNFTRRQDCPKVYEINGAIYVINVQALKKMALHQMTKVRKYEMDEWSSHDIDTSLDWLIAEQMTKEIKQ